MSIGLLLGQENQLKINRRYGFCEKLIDSHLVFFVQEPNIISLDK